jgi:allantoicase
LTTSEKGRRVTATSGSPDCDGVPGTPKVRGQLASLIDLASRWLGGSVLAASDESFGDKDNLLNPGPATYQDGRLGILTVGEWLPLQQPAEAGWAGRREDAR